MLLRPGPVPPAVLWAALCLLPAAQARGADEAGEATNTFKPGASSEVSSTPGARPSATGAGEQLGPDGKPVSAEQEEDEEEEEEKGSEEEERRSMDVHEQIHSAQQDRISGSGLDGEWEKALRNESEGDPDPEKVPGQRDKREGDPEEETAEPTEGDNTLHRKPWVPKVKGKRVDVPAGMLWSPSWGAPGPSKSDAEKKAEAKKAAEKAASTAGGSGSGGSGNLSSKKAAQPDRQRATQRALENAKSLVDPQRAASVLKAASGGPLAGSAGAPSPGASSSGGPGQSLFGAAAAGAMAGAAALGSGGPSNPASLKDFAAAGSSGYRDLFRGMGMKVSGDSVLGPSGGPATPAELEALRRAIQSQPQALLRRPDFFSHLTPGEFTDLKTEYKAQDPAHSRDFKDISLTKDDRDFAHTRSCNPSLEKDCNPHAEEPYRKEEFVSPDVLDRMWDAIFQKSARGGSGTEEAAGDSGRDAARAGRAKKGARAAAAESARASALGLARDLLVGRKAGAQPRDEGSGAAVPDGGDARSGTQAAEAPDGTSLVRPSERTFRIEVPQRRRPWLLYLLCLVGAWLLLYKGAKRFFKAFSDTSLD